MALSWTDLQRKTQRLTRDSTDATLEQIQQDLNTGYHMFNNKLARYWSRKQQFTDLIAGQGTYQTPVDSIRVETIVISVSNTYQIPVKEIRSEYEWRQITSYPYTSNWPAYFFIIGNDQVALWPTPSQSVTNGMRFVYQQDDFNMSVDDIFSTDVNATATFTRGESIVELSNGILTPQMVGLHIQNTGVTNLTWYEITEVLDSSYLRMKSAFVGISGSGLGFRIGQLPIIPSAYHDALCHYAAGMFFSSKGNELRFQQHLGTEDKPGVYYDAITNALQQYSSSTQGRVITDSDTYTNAWFLTPFPPPGA